jgi:hypothetical protein
MRKDYKYFIMSTDEVPKYHSLNCKQGPRGSELDVRM